MKTCQYYWNQTLPASYNGYTLCDGSSDPGSFQSASGNNGQIAQYITGDFNRVPATLIGGRNNLRFINMTGYTSAYPYTRRYVDKLKVR